MSNDFIGRWRISARRGIESANQFECLITKEKVKEACGKETVMFVSTRKSCKQIF